MLAIIGGTGFDGIQGFKESGFKRILTPFSKDRVIIELYSKLCDGGCCFATW